jgi:hypothetical protein
MIPSDAARRLSRREQGGIERGRALLILHGLLAFFDDADDGIAGPAFWVFIDGPEDLLQPDYLVSVSPSCFSKAARKSSEIAALAILGKAVRIFFSAKVDVFQPVVKQVIEKALAAARAWLMAFSILTVVLPRLLPEGAHGLGMISSG